MKKVLLFAVVLGAISFTSCKKDHTCVCTIAGESDSTELKDLTKSDAEDACDALGIFYTLGGGTCELD